MLKAWKEKASIAVCPQGIVCLYRASEWPVKLHEKCTSYITLWFRDSHNCSLKKKERKMRRGEGYLFSILLANRKTDDWAITSIKNNLCHPHSFSSIDFHIKNGARQHRPFKSKLMILVSFRVCVCVCPFAVVLIDPIISPTVVN